MRRLLGVLAASALLPIGVQLAAAQAPSQAKPGPEYERLGYFVGKWTGEGEIKPGPMGPGGKFTSSDDCAWFEGHFSVVCHSESKMPMGAEQEHRHPGLQRGGKGLHLLRRGQHEHDHGQRPEGHRPWKHVDVQRRRMMGGKKVKTRVTIKELSPNEYSFTMEAQGRTGSGCR